MNKILLAHDLSRGAQRALPFALDLAARTGAYLHVVCVQVAPRSTDADATEPGVCLEELRGRLHRNVVSHRGYLAVDPGQVRTKVVNGIDAASSLLDYSHHHDIDVLVMGFHGWGGAQKGVPGRIAREIVRQSSRPVLTVDGNSSSNPTRIRRILVPVDFSGHSARALREAKEIAAVWDATLVLLFVAEDWHVLNFKNDGLPARYDVPPDPCLVAWADDALRQMAEEAGVKPNETEYHVAVGRPDRQIVTFARREAIDLVVMSSHGRGALRYFPLGSVTEAVVRSAPCPVLTSRAFGTSLLAEAESVLSGSNGEVETGATHTGAGTVPADPHGTPTPGARIPRYRVTALAGSL